MPGSSAGSPRATPRARRRRCWRTSKARASASSPCSRHDVFCMMSVLADRSPARTLTVCGSIHALHDGFTDLLNVLYPLLQAQFGLSYAAIGALKTVYSSGMAVGQIPSGKLAVRFGGVRVLAIGTALIAVGYGLAGLTGSMYGVVF